MADLGDGPGQRFGSCAISPPRDSSTFVGIVESNEVKARLQPGALLSQQTRDCDNDHVLDAGESMHVTVPIANPGPVALANVTVNVTSAIAGLHIAPATTTIGSLAAYGDTREVRPHRGRWRSPATMPAVRSVVVQDWAACCSARLCCCADAGADCTRLCEPGRLW